MYLKIKNTLANHWCRLKNSGFTLIELMVVMAIISLFATFVYAEVLIGPLQKANYARMMSDFHQMELAARLFKSNEKFYSCDSPPGYDSSFNGGGRYIAPASELGVTCQNKGMVETGLLPRVPKAPCPGFDYDWENWSPGVALPTGTGQVVRITLRGPAPAYASLYYFCIMDTHGSTEYACGGKTGDHGYTLGGIMVNGKKGGKLVCS